jgi:hypothetical protein
LSFSDSDWTRDPPLRARVTPAQSRMWMLAVAIAVSCLAIATAYYGVEQLLDSAAQSEALKGVGAVVTPAPRPAAVAASASVPLATAPSSTAASAPESPRPPLPIAGASAAAAPAPSAAAAGSTDAVDAGKLAALEAEMRQRAREAAEQAAADAVRRKERAWERFYQRPAFCNENPTGAQMVLCANQYIRARREFEERYNAGRP